VKVLLLNPPPLNNQIYMKEVARCGRKSITGEIWPQTGLAHIASVLEKEGHEVKIIDGMVGPKTAEQTLTSIKLFNPEMIVINTSTPTIVNDMKFCEIIKKNSNSSVVLLGTHASALPRESLISSEADFVVVNEGELVIKELAGNNDFKHIKGLCYKEAEKIKCNLPREPITNLDDLPLPARHLLENDKYTMPLTKGKSFATIISSRGCNFNCIFCRTKTGWGSGFRTRSVNNVIEEIKDVVHNYKINFVVFMTDTFTNDRHWVLRLCKSIIKEKIAFKWLCNSRVDTVDEEMLVAMKKAGCLIISYGIESGSQEILDNAKKGIELGQSKKAISLTKKVGIKSIGYYVLGLPGETIETIKQTIKFAKELDTGYANFHIATPFPGTEFYDTAEKNNWLITKDWEKYEERGSCVISTETLKPNDLIRMQEFAMRQFYLRPKKIFKELLDNMRLNDLKILIKTGMKVLK